MGGEGDGVSYKEVVPFRPTYTILCSFTIPCEYFIVHTMALLGLYVFFILWALKFMNTAITQGTSCPIGPNIYVHP